MANFFDQFDEQTKQPAAQPTSNKQTNYFDQFDDEQQGAAQAAPAQPQQQEQPSIASQIGQGVLESGRAIAGGVSGLANVGVGLYNTVGREVQDFSNYVTGENAQFSPMPAAGYGDLDKYVQPQTTAGKVIADVIPYVAGGEIAAPIKAAEGAGMIARVGTSFARNFEATLPSTLSKYNQGNGSDDAVLDQVVNTLAGSGFELAGKAVQGARKILPEWMGGISTAEQAANSVAPEHLNRVTQGGNQEAQQVYKTATTDEAGNTILNPSQVLDPNSGLGRSAIAQEQANIARNSGSTQAQNIAAQQSGESISRAVDNAAPQGDLQQAASDVVGAIKERSKQLYTESKANAQKILDNYPLKITELKLPDSKNIAQQHLDANAASGDIKLTTDARKTLKSFNDAKFNDINTIDDWKRELSNKMQKAYRDSEFTTYNALKDVRDSLRNEADNAITAIDPNAGSIYRDADRYFSQTVGDFGKKSPLNKIATNDNAVRANDVMLGAGSLAGRYQGITNTNDILSAVDAAATRGEIDPALAQQLRDSLGGATREQAFNAASTGENFSPKVFANRLNQYAPQAEAAGQAETNQALADSVRTLINRAKVGPSLANRAGTLAGTVGGGAVGAHLAGPLGGGFGATAGAAIGTTINDAVTGLVNKLSRTGSRSQAVIDFVSQPENAQKVLDILAQRGATAENATGHEISGIVKALTATQAPSLLESAPENDRPIPVTTYEAAPQPAPEPEQHAQAVKMPRKYDDAQRFYIAMSDAETGGLQNRFIRTMAPEGGKTSTAYGPAQLTVTHASDFLKNHPKLFTPSEKDYLNRFIQQGNTMLHADPNDPVYGYGKSGTLTSDADQRLYAQVAVKMLDVMRKEHGGSYDRTIIAWRGRGDDTKYNAKILASMKRTREGNEQADKPAARTRQGWGRR
ncbi:hypothetical protein OXE08_004522 [Salmonella enterica]|nr:hypothetical protein [Salmonella enterica]